MRKFFFKTNTSKERMKKIVALLTAEKPLRMNGKIMTLTFFKPYTLYIKILVQIFSTLTC